MAKIFTTKPVNIYRQNSQHVKLKLISKLSMSMRRTLKIQWRIQDFVWEELTLNYLGQTFPKLHENEENWTRDASKICIGRSASDFCISCGDITANDDNSNNNNNNAVGISGSTWNVCSSKEAQIKIEISGSD